MLIFLYIIIPVLLLNWHYNKKKVKDVGYVYLLILLVMCIAATLYYNHPQYKLSTHAGVVSFLPIIYWFGLLYIWINPFLHFKFKNFEMKKVNVNLLEYVSYFFILISIITSILYLPHIRTSFDAVSFIENKELAQYGNFKVSNNRILESISNIHSNFRTIITFIFFYTLSFIPRRKGLKIALGLSSVIPIILISLAKSIRLDIVYMAFYFLINFAIFRPFLTNRVRKLLNRISIIIGSIVLFVVISFSLIRFVSDNGFHLDPSFYILSYMGESILNFNTLMFNNLNTTTDGNANFPYLLKLVGLEYSETGQDFKEKYLHLLDYSTWFFYSFIGAFLRDLGYVGNYIFGVVIMVSAKVTIFKPKKALSFVTLYLITLYIDFCMCGLFFNKYSGFHGNVNLRNLLILSILLRLFFSLKKK